MRRVLIVGAGGHGQVVADILLAAARRGAADTPIGFLDDDPGALGRSVLGLPVLGSTAALAAVEHDAVVLAIGDNLVRWRLWRKLLGLGAVFASAVHPDAIVGLDAHLGSGVVVCAGAVVGTGAWIGDCAILNTGCGVDHHGQIGACAHVAPGAHLGGSVRVGYGALVGMGAAVLPGCAIGDWAVVGAGSVVVGHVAAGATVVGAPARPTPSRERSVRPGAPLVGE